MLECHQLAQGFGDPLLRFADGATLRELAPWAHCWCGHRLGRLGNAPRGRTEREQQREIAKLQKKGWGEAKIRRWVEQREKNDVLAASRYAHAFERAATRPDDEWAIFIRQTLERGLATRIGIVHHNDFNQHSNDDIHDGATRTLSTFMQRDLDAMEFGAILTVTADRT